LTVGFANPDDGLLPSRHYWTNTDSDAQAAYDQLMLMAEDLAASGEYQSVARHSLRSSRIRRTPSEPPGHKRPNARTLNQFATLTVVGPRQRRDGRPMAFKAAAISRRLTAWTAPAKLD